jgi:hypothetical protein
MEQVLGLLGLPPSRNTVSTALALTQDHGRTLCPDRSRNHRHSENSRPIGELPSIFVIRTESISLTALT